MRLFVVVALVLDAASVLQDLRVVEGGWSPAGVTTTLQLVLAVAAAASVMWLRPRLALVLCGLVLGLALVHRGTSEELWLMLVVAVTVAARARLRVVVLVGAAQLGYGVLFALRVEHRDPGGGVQAAVVVATFCATGYVAGFVVRRLLGVLERRRQRLAELEQENAQIRAAERSRLADDLQVVVTGGLATIQRELRELYGRAGDGRALRRGLDRIDQESRAVLTELRALLEVLRRDPSSVVAEPTGSAPGGGRRFLETVTARRVRLASTAVFALLAARAVAGRDGALLDPGLAVQVLGWVAAAVAVWAPRAGALTAAGALVVSVAGGTPSDWDALPTLVLFVVSAARARARRLWMVVVGLVGYLVLVAVTATSWADRILLAGYAGALGIIGGLAAGHFLEIERASARRRAGLLHDRGRMEGQERTAVARDLHDVVAHQLSLTSLMIMGTSASTDPQVLSATAGKVEEAVDAAGHELSTLLHALRGARTEEVRSSPLVLPSAGAGTIARRLTASGFQPHVSTDPAADELDATTQRTLGRIMQEATTNIVRYAPAGSTCRYALSVSDDRVQLTVANPLPVREGRSTFSLGWGLRGIAERVELSHGSFTAGPRRGQWLVDVTLPRSVDRGAVPAEELAR